jgi:hypothetical protein
VANQANTIRTKPFANLTLQREQTGDEATISNENVGRRNIQEFDIPSNVQLQFMKTVAEQTRTFVN